MTLQFSRQVWFYLASAFSFGLAQAFMMLFLNFYLRAAGLGTEWQGIINAMPAIILALACLPAVVVAKHTSNAHALKIGGGLVLMSMLILAATSNPLIMMLGTLFSGIGSAFTVVASSPFLANNSDEKTRVTLFSLQMALITGAGFLGNLLGGQLPDIYSKAFGGDSDGIVALRMALLTAAALQLAGLIPLLFLKPTGKTKPGQRSLAIKDKNTMFRLVLPTFVVGFGAGATVPFLNVFIEGKFQIDYASLGTLFAWTSLATAVTALIQPTLVRRLGQLPTVLAVQFGSLPFLAMLGFAPYIELVALALFTRGALMNAAGPVYSAYAMTVLPPEDRPMYSATTTIAWNVSWAASSIASGVVRGALPFNTAFNMLFAWTLFMYICSTLAIYFGLYRSKHLTKP